MFTGKLSALLPLQNPTAGLPRLKVEPTLAALDKALSQLALIYAPALLSKDLQAEVSRDTDAQDAIDLVRADVNERSFAASWLMRLIALDAGWLLEQDVSQQDREAVIDRAGQIVAAQSQVDESEAGSIVRRFTFPLSLKPVQPGSSQLTFVQPSSTDEPSVSEPGQVTVELRDEPLPPSRDDKQEESSSSATSVEFVPQSKLASYQAATAVGVQTWAAAAFLSDWLLRDISRLHSDLTQPGSSSSSRPFRTLELGAGTGLVGLALAKYFAQQRTEALQGAEVCLTDFHEQVLSNLRYNVTANREIAHTHPSSSPPPPSRVSVESLDWEEVHHAYCAARDRPTHTTPPTYADRWWAAPHQASSWPSLTAADCIYSPSHARWLASTIAYFLAPPLVDPQARAVMIMANRTRGRFGEWELRQSVETAFGAPNLVSPAAASARLQIVDRTELPRIRGLGRDDEDGYIIWTFAFQPCR
ncbi:hypothetical protein OC834_001548 [Tilletia horrida]|uniref:Uncharacterized protein n=1 Tax=Tilletia horrida TaxID=155126 RepID=A0AAN6GCS7_9BASI|nr:hypothetical protein OC842_005157 [Tilletia horrida]KAK0535383.1 hypothetical protein OC834_001548 [Tilletia horrida]